MNSAEDHKGASFKLKGALIVAYIMLAPLSRLVPPLPLVGAVNPIRLIGLGILFFAVVSVIAKREKVPARVRFIHVLAVLFFVSIIPSAMDALQVTLGGIFTVTVFIGFLILLTDEFPFRDVLQIHRVILYVILFTATVSAVEQMGLLPVPSYRKDLASVFEQVRTASLFDTAIGVWSLLSAFLLIELSPRKSDKWLVLLALPAALSIVVGGQFRSYLLASALIISIGLLRQWLFGKRFLIGFAALCVGLVTFLLLATTIAGPMMAINTRFERLLQLPELIDAAMSQDVEDQSVQSRRAENEQSKELIAEAPLLGHGWSVAEEDPLESATQGTIPLHGHNMYYAWPLRIGLPFSLVFLFAFFMVFLSSLRHMNFAREGAQGVFCSYACLALTVFFLVGFLQDLSRMSMSFPLLAVFISPVLKPAISAGLTMEPSVGRGRGQRVIRQRPR